MKFNISKDDLLGALNVVSKGMASRSTLPILSGILIETGEDGTLVFQTTDLEISIKHTVKADIVETGKTVIPGKLLSDIVKSLPDAAVSIHSNQDRTSICCMDSTFRLSSLNPADFPYFPEILPNQSIELPSKGLANAVKKVSKAVSRDEARAILTGVLFSVENGTARFVATDSYRLAVADLPLEGYEGEDFQAIVPGKIFDDVSRLALASETLVIGFSDNQIIFKFGETVLVSRKIEGTYPNYKQLLPMSYEVSIQVDTAAFVTALKRVSLLAQAHTSTHLRFDADEQHVIVEAKTQDVGGAEEIVPAKIEGESIEIAFNHQYILDGLSVIDGTTVIELQSSLRPGILKSTADESFLYLAMPVRLG